MHFEVLDEQPLTQVTPSEKVKGLSERVLFDCKKHLSSLITGKLKIVLSCELAPEGFFSDYKQGNAILGGAKAFFILAGEAVMTVNNNEFLIEPASLVIVEAGEVYGMKNNSDYPCTYLTWEITNSSK